MCILIHHPAGSELTDEHFADFYTSNPDGFGAIINTGRKVEVIKRVGTLREIQHLYHKFVKGHDAVIHMRWRTHGDIDLANCHPYEVVPGLWMSHNGVLSTGNTADPTKSDTWHYINEYLRPLLARDPELIHEPAFQTLVERHIGYSNKFGFMSSDGRSVIINRDAGLEHEGVWYSNTYAWTPSKFGYKYPGANTSYHYGSSPTWAAWNSMDNTAQRQLAWGQDPVGKPVSKRGKKAKKKTVGKRKADLSAPLGRLATDSLARIIRKLYNEMMTDDYLGVLRWVEGNPMQAMHFIKELFPDYSDQEISDMVNMDPAAATEMIYDGWDVAEPDLLDLAGINVNYGELVEENQDAV